MEYGQAGRHLSASRVKMGPVLPFRWGLMWIRAGMVRMLLFWKRSGKCLWSTRMKKTVCGAASSGLSRADGRG